MAKYPTYEIVHTRDPDGDCEISLFHRGGRASGVEVYDIDPGRGYVRAEWDDTTAHIVQRASPEAGKLVKRLRDEQAEDSQYIEDDGEYRRRGSAGRTASRSARRAGRR